MNQPIEPAILAYGRTVRHRYSERTLANVLKYDFGDPENSLILDSNPRYRNLAAAMAAWGVEHGYLYVARVAQGDQEQVAEFKLTDKGKEFISAEA